MLAYTGCPGENAIKWAVKRVSICHVVYFNTEDINTMHII